jgi:cold shock CspA family protein
VTGDAPLVAATVRWVHTPLFVEYGFVRRDSGGRDLLFHRSVVEGDADGLTPGRRVRIALMTGLDGKPRVSRLRLAE